MRPTRHPTHKGTHDDRSALLGVIGGLLIAIYAASCAAGGSAKRASSAPSSEGPDAMATSEADDAAPAVASGRAMPMSREQADINELWYQIRNWRVELGIGTEPSMAHGNYAADSVVDLRTCDVNKDRHDVPETCQDPCKLKDAICDNAESICRIAEDLDGDAWADEKCQSAKASCREATEKCCGCLDKAAAQIFGTGANTFSQPPQ